MTRAINFCPGPAAMPAAVLKHAQQEMLDFQGKGLSVMEMSHRSKEFMDIAEVAEQDLRDLMSIPDSYKVLFLQGGASTQFSMVPLNLLRGKKSADYVNTGIWSKKAIKEAMCFCDVNVAASGESVHFSHIPAESTWETNADAAYLHYTPNETIGGVEFHSIPETNDVPLVADMSSTILSRPVDVSRFGLIYAGAQKNIGPAGITVIIVREDLIGEALPSTPTMLDYKVHVDNGSLYNTPPTYSWYLAGLVFKWLKRQGGLESIARTNQTKAEKLYAAIDQSDFFDNPIDPSARSWMNVPFTLSNPDLDAEFLKQAEQQQLLNLKGHRSVGGMRASIYNAISQENVDTLIAFMNAFEKKFG